MVYFARQLVKYEKKHYDIYEITVADETHNIVFCFQRKFKLSQGPFQIQPNHFFLKRESYLHQAKF